MLISKKDGVNFDRSLFNFSFDSRLTHIFTSTQAPTFFGIQLELLWQTSAVIVTGRFAVLVFRLFSESPQWLISATNEVDAF